MLAAGLLSWVNHQLPTISIPSVPQDIVQRLMTHPQIDKAWEHVPEFTRDVLKTISDQSAEIELLKTK